MPTTPDGKPWMIADCVTCGIVGAGPQETLPVTVGLHYNQTHPDVRVVVEGVHWTSRVAALRCDTCTIEVELPYWCHISDPPTHTRIMQDSDGRWLLCDACHRCAVTRDLSGWVRRVWAGAVRESPFLEKIPPAERDKSRAQMAAHLRSLMGNLDAGERNTVWNPGPLKP